MNTNRDKIKLLFIAGAGRSGSTVIDRVLGQVPGFFSLGEFHTLWVNLQRDDRLCGCGVGLKQCDFWNTVLHDAFGCDEDIARQVRIYRKYGGDRMRYMPLMPLPGAKWLLSRYVRRNLDGLVRIYRAVAARSGAKVIVDSSKLPTYGFALSQSPALDVHVMQLVRDQRGVAHSWRRKKARTDTANNGKVVDFMDNMGPVASSLIWDGINLATERIWKGARGRYMLLRYEDFVADPASEVRRICRLVGEEPGTLSFINGTEVRFGTDHTVAGNPGRVAKGAVKLEPDDEWKTKLSPRDRMIVNTLSGPLLRRYGYLPDGKEADRTPSGAVTDPATRERGIGT